MFTCDANNKKIILSPASNDHLLSFLNIIGNFYFNFEHIGQRAREARVGIALVLFITLTRREKKKKVSISRGYSITSIPVPGYIVS